MLTTGLAEWLPPPGWTPDSRSLTRPTRTILDGHPAHAGSSLHHGHDQEELVQDLLGTLKQCVERVDRYRRLGQRVGESNTKAGLIEPIIAALGWDVLDPDEVHREYLSEIDGRAPC
jgi:hypothetical protein